jgi:hypothetical protein
MVEVTQGVAVGGDVEVGKSGRGGDISVGVEDSTPQAPSNIVMAKRYATVLKPTSNARGCLLDRELSILVNHFTIDDDFSAVAHIAD